MLKKSALIVSVLCLAVMSGCGSLNGDSSSEGTASQSTERETRLYVTTTKTMTAAESLDENDEDIEGYTTTSEVTGSLENSYSAVTDPDEDILATHSTTTTLYTIPSGAVIETTTTLETEKSSTTTKDTTTSVTTTTAFTADKLYNPTDESKYDEKIRYHVVSDTTYLNLRFGPSKKYDIQLKIPDGEYVYGTAKTTNPNDDSEYWVFVSYNGTSGWVMLELLEEAD